MVMTELSSGTRLSDMYVIERLVGAGGMGEVYAATKLDDGRRVAIKMLRADLADDAEVVARFRLEAAVVTALRHPNIVQVTDFRAELGEPLYFVMELLEGETLRDRIRAEGPMAPARVVAMAGQILAALAAAHAAGIVHRDVKPANVFLTRTVADESVKLLDFGLATPDTLAAWLETGPLSRDGQILGSPSYMAPEQALGLNVDARTDLFSVGALMYEAITGRRPRGERGVESASVFECASLREIAPWIPAPLASIVDRALSVDPEERFSSAVEMPSTLHDLDHAPRTIGVGRCSDPSTDLEDAGETTLGSAA
jgi:serine/threonine-protein kinase